MSFNKRYLTKEGIMSNLDNLYDYLDKPDAIFIMDEFSEKIYEMYNNDISEFEIKEYIKLNYE